MRICILTRADIFPANHGAAVKITQTAQKLSLLEDQKYISSLLIEIFIGSVNEVFL